MFSLAFGVGTKDNNGNWLEVFYPIPLLHPETSITALIANILHVYDTNTFIELDHTHLRKLNEALQLVSPAQADLLALYEGSSRPVVATLLSTDSKPTSVPEVYLKLHLLSHRMVKPHALNLDGIFSLLPNVAWTNKGPVALGELATKQLNARLQGKTLEVTSVDKFPKMTDYVVPSGVRIADSARVRLGAYIGEGTTIMHEGFVNFNAGTAGPAMIEGRISAGVFVNSNSDLGGGCSILGTLSGGGKEVISSKLRQVGLQGNVWCGPRRPPFAKKLPLWSLRHCTKKHFLQRAHPSISFRGIPSCCSSKLPIFWVSAWRTCL